MKRIVAIGMMLIFSLSLGGIGWAQEKPAQNPAPAEKPSPPQTPAPPETPQPPAAGKPRVLILGDSISIAYTPIVREMMKEEATIIRPMLDAKRPENCDGTKTGVKELARWLKLEGGGWDVIHFNFGLHDLKRVDAQTGKATNNPQDPRQSEPEAYEKQLRQIVAELKKSGASLIFATTTPVPPGGVRPHRDTTDPDRYNQIALKIMKENGVAINDLYALAQPRLKEIQQPVNVHFNKAGSKLLAEQVVKSIREGVKGRKAGK